MDHLLRNRAIIHLDRALKQGCGLLLATDRVLPILARLSLFRVEMRAWCQCLTPIVFTTASATAGCDFPELVPGRYWKSICQIAHSYYYVGEQLQQQQVSANRIVLECCQIVEQTVGVDPGDLLIVLDTLLKNNYPHSAVIEATTTLLPSSNVNVGVEYDRMIAELQAGETREQKQHREMLTKRCHKADCRSTKLTATPVITKSADESFDVDLECLDCGHKWRERFK